MDGETPKVPEHQTYTVDEVRGFLRLSRSKVYELLATGELASIKIGAARRVPAKDLAHFIAKSAT